MAVVNAYVVDAKTAGGAAKDSTRYHGGEVVAIVTRPFTVAAADSDGSIYRIGKVNKNLVPVQIDINCSVITGGSSYDLGLYRTLENGGAVKDADVFMANVDLSGGKAIGSEQNGLAALTVANIGKQIWELAGATTENDADLEYDLALTGDTVGTGTGTIMVRALFAKTA
jgi:hypothetical protein